MTGSGPVGMARGAAVGVCVRAAIPLLRAAREANILVDTDTVVAGVFIPEVEEDSLSVDVVES